MCISGSDSNSPEIEVVDGKKVVKKPCVVKFRPCKHWRGEYGFDWARVPFDEFEERRDFDSTRDVGDKMMPVDVSVENYLKKTMGKDKHGESLFDKEVGKRLMELRKEHKNDNPPFDFDAARNKIVDELYIKHYDPHLWKTLGPGQDSFSEQTREISLSDCPLEYFYAPVAHKQITSGLSTPYFQVSYVRYRIARQEYGNVFWMDCINYEDMGNGDEVAQNATDLDWVVHMDGVHQSLKKNDDDSYSIPLYEVDYVVSSGEVIGADSKKFVSYEKNGCAVSLLYWMVESATANNAFTKHLKVLVSPNAEDDSYWYYFKDGIYMLSGVGGALSIDDSIPQSYAYDSNVDHDKIREFKKRFIDDETDIDIIRNNNVDIYHLLKDSSKDRVMVELNNPNKTKFIPLSEVQVKDDKPYWDKWEIFSWEEWHQSTFGTLHKYDEILLVEGEEETEAYYIPILSIGIDTQRTKFEFRSFYDAPKEKPEVANVYNLQLFIKGKCDKLRLNYDTDMFEVKPSNDISVNVDGNTSMEITVRFKGDRVSAVRKSPLYITACAVDDRGNAGPEVGKMRVKVGDGFEVKGAFVRVIIGEGPFDSRINDCLPDQLKGISNALSQMGIHSSISDEYSIVIDESEIKPFKDGDKLKRIAFVEESQTLRRLGDLFVDRFLESYKKKIDIHYEYLFFFINNQLDENVAAYATLYKDYSYVVSSNSISEARMDVYVMAHELLHRLRLTHSFQLVGYIYRSEVCNPGNESGTVYVNNEFCYPFATTTNIMDYHCFAYSLRKEQWREAILGISTHEMWAEEKVKMARERLERSKKSAAAVKKKRKQDKKRKK